MFSFNTDTDSPFITSVPCVVELSIGGYKEIRNYGPFANIIEAREWCSRQLPNSWRIIPLRRIDKERTENGHWYNPDYLDTENMVDDFIELEEYKKWETDNANK